MWIQVAPAVGEDQDKDVMCWVEDRITYPISEDIKEAFLQEIMVIAAMEKTPPELILNSDQTGMKLVPSSDWIMEERGARRA